MNTLWISAAFLAVGGGEVRQEFYHDFRGQASLSPMFTKYGPNWAGYVRSEPEGLHIHLPNDRKKMGPTGVVLETSVGGDFEITMGFDFLNAEVDAKAAYGAGLNLGLRTKSPAADGVVFGRFMRQNPGDSFLIQKFANNAEGKHQETNTVFKAEIRKGWLRILREADQVKFLAAPVETPDAFALVHRLPFTRDDVTAVRMAANTGFSAVDLDVRVLDVRIRAERITHTSPTAKTPNAAKATSNSSASSKAAPERADPTERGNSLIWLLVFLLIVVVLFFLSYFWFWWQKRKKSKQVVTPAKAADQKPQSKP